MCCVAVGDKASYEKQGLGRQRADVFDDGMVLMLSGLRQPRLYRAGRTTFTNELRRAA